MMEYWTLAFLTLTAFVRTQRIVIPPEDATGILGESVKFECTVEFGPIRTMAWEFNDDIIYSIEAGNEKYPSGNVKYHVTQEGTRFTLWIKILDVSDCGKYTCTAMVSSASAVLVVLDTPQMSASALGSAEGAIAEYTCEAQFASPDKILPEQNPTLGMFLAGHTLIGVAREEKCESVTNCYYYTQTTNLTLEASMNGKQLMCDISTSQPPVHVNISTIITVLYSVRNVSYTPDNGQYEVGTKITCLADGNPKPQYVWDNMYTGNFINGDALNVKEEMLGANSWRCTARNFIKGTLHEETTVADFTVVKPGDNKEAGNASVGIGLGVTFAVCVFGVILTLMYCSIKHKKPTCMTAEKSQRQCKESGTKSSGTVHENEHLLSNGEKGDNDILDCQSSTDVADVEGRLSKDGHSECSTPGHRDVLKVQKSDSLNAYDHPPKDANKPCFEETQAPSQQIVVILEDDKSDKNSSINKVENHVGTTPMTTLASTAAATISQSHFNTKATQSMPSNSNVSQNIKEKSKKSDGTDTESQATVEGTDQLLEKSVSLRDDKSKPNVGDNVKGNKGKKKYPAPGVPSSNSLHKNDDGSVSQLQGAHTSTSPKDTTEENNEPEERNKITHSTETENCQEIGLSDPEESVPLGSEGKLDVKGNKDKSSLNNEKSKVNAGDEIKKKSKEDPAPETSKLSLHTDNNGSLSQSDGAPTSASSRDTIQKTQVEGTDRPHDEPEMLSSNQKDDNNVGDVTEISNLKPSLMNPDSIHSSSERIEAQTSSNLSASLPGDKGVSSTRAAGQQDREVNTDDVVEQNTVKGYALGNGNFGDIINTRHLDKDVTIFRCKELQSEDIEKAFFHGGRLLMKYRHTSIAKFIGITSTQRSDRIMMEHESGGVLEQFLREHGRDTDKSQLIKMCEDVLDGMIYLEKQHCIHRALASCNCLVGENKAVKIFNFSWAREGQEFHGDPHEPVPIRSASPEALKYGKYSFSSEVWSFGVLIWEIFSHGETPYGKNGETREGLICWLENGEKLTTPDGMPSVIEKIVSDCWKDMPNERPSSISLKLKVSNVRKSGTTKLTLLQSTGASEALEV